MNERPPAWLEAELYLERFEAAWSRDGDADLADFLPPRDHPLYLLILRELACVDMELNRGQSGRHIEVYCDRFPELCSDPDAVRVLREQEDRLRRADAESEATSRHTPASVAGWREQAETLYAAYRRGDSSLRPGSLDHAELLLALDGLPLAPFPDVGGDFLGFRLLRELGRGAFGRVFLAEQKGLANRLVALKVGTDLLGESQTLAQLQHSHIVPIYSSHRAGSLQAVCMPYFGPTTLADVLKSMRRQGGVPTTGNALWSTLRERGPDRVPEPVPVEVAPRPEPTPSREALRDLTHVRTVLWIGACLADGLAHAHEHGILHRDLKPANVLLADDGTPMLLDFNLSQDVRLRGDVPAVLGGTLPYMAPEHLEAVQGADAVVDARSDVYALGLILFELLTGQHPFPPRPGPLRGQVPQMVADRHTGPPSVRKLNRAASPAVEAIVRRCLEPDPVRRYPSARALQEDLGRQLDHLPLRHTPEPSLREWAGKFLRRHPRIKWVGAVVLLIGLLVGLGLLYELRGRRVRAVEAVNVLHDHREELRDARIVLSLPFPDAGELEEGEALCQRALARYGLPDANDWAERPQVTALPAEQRDALRADLGELLLLSARATWLRGGRVEEALWLNESASVLVGPDNERSVLLQRALLLRLANRNAEAEATLQRGRALPPQTARDYYLLAGELASQGEVREATRLLEEATRREPSNAAAWAARGACHASLGQPQQAVAAFTTCVALRPDFWRGHLWRGQAHLEAGEPARAAADFDTVLRLRPGFVPALVFRALARLATKDLAGAEADLTAALESKTDHTRIFFQRARVRQAAGDAEGARRDFEEGLKREPSDELSWVARGLARLPRDPNAALADFDAALKLNPSSRSAAQNKAHVLAEHLNRPDDAVAVLNPLVRRYPDFVEARIGRGVLHARLGRRKVAHEDAAESLSRDTRPLILYQGGCVYSLTSRQEADDRREAVRLLTAALRGGFGVNVLETDPDLAPLRGEREYGRLRELARELQQQSPP
jgi:eukaryotic-like serine/threonine-protein kinase